MNYNSKANSSQGKLSVSRIVGNNAEYYINNHSWMRNDVSMEWIGLYCFTQINVPENIFEGNILIYRVPSSNPKQVNSKSTITFQE